jgi:hypothetical protein
VRFLNALRKIRLTSYKQKILAEIAEAAERHDDELVNRLYQQYIQVDQELVGL